MIRATLLKSYAFVTVLITMMVVSTVTAQDTLRVQSLRSIDLCSGAKRWLIAVSVGTIRFSDSLESFDITIGFNRRALRPTDILKEGTLSAQMSNGPTLNTVTPGEMRIFGFNIARSVAGDLPLVAVAGDFIGTCEDEGDLTVPFAPDFNGEFRKRFTVSLTDSIETFLKTRLSNDAGCVFESDSLTVSDNASDGYAELRVKQSGSRRDSTGRINLTYVNKPTSLGIGDIRGLNCQIDSVTSSTTGASIFFRKSSTDTAETLLLIQVKRNGSLIEDYLNIEARLFSSDQCECSVPGLIDTLFIRSEKPIVGVTTSYDDDTCTIEVLDDFIIGKCPHHEMKILEVIDLLGHHIRSQRNHDNRAIEASIADLPSGMHLVVMRCGSRISMKTIVK